MKKVILDTDIGIDCDDAIALALLINLAKQKHCHIEAITTSTTRIGAISSIRSICDYYGYKTLIGKMNYPVLACDTLELNKYALKIKNEFEFDDECEDSIKVLREVLSSTKEKITVITIGPLTNINKLLKSPPDDISPKSGLELFNENVDEIYSMGGCFLSTKEEPNAEWNIVQDIKSAQSFLKHVNVPITFIPQEVGRVVLTGQILHQNITNPVYKSLKYFHQFDRDVNEFDILSRESWDPITCYIAVLGVNNLFELSGYGNIILDDEGVTHFTKNERGKHRYVLLNGKLQEIEESINQLIVR